MFFVIVSTNVWVVKRENLTLMDRMVEAGELVSVKFRGGKKGMRSGMPFSYRIPLGDGTAKKVPF